MLLSIFYNLMFTCDSKYSRFAFNDIREIHFLMC